MAPRALIKVGKGATFKSTNCVYVSQGNGIVVDGGVAEFHGSCISGGNIGLDIRGEAEVSADTGSVFIGRNTGVRVKEELPEKTQNILEKFGSTAGKSIRNQL